jgi:hypothetical protein
MSHRPKRNAATLAETRMSNQAKDESMYDADGCALEVVDTVAATVSEDRSDKKRSRKSKVVNDHVNDHSHGPVAKVKDEEDIFKNSKSSDEGDEASRPNKRPVLKDVGNNSPKESPRQTCNPFEKQQFSDTGIQRKDLSLDTGMKTNKHSKGFDFTIMHRGVEYRSAGYPELRDCSYVKLATRLLLQVSLNLLILSH